ncbi:MAG: hypothetical protein AAFX90_12520 [Pseudomonadota bacterium]
MTDAIHELKMLETGGYPLDQPIIIDDGSGSPTVVAVVEDAESDILMLTFHVDGEIEIQTEKYSYVTLFRALLSELEDMIDDATELWAQLQRYWDDKQDNWIGWEHLAAQPNTVD